MKSGLLLLQSGGKSTYGRGLLTKLSNPTRHMQLILSRANVCFVGKNHLCCSHMPTAVYVIMCVVQTIIQCGAPRELPIILSTELQECFAKLIKYAFNVATEYCVTYNHIKLSYLKTF